MTDLINRGLPKWPQMLTTGERVSVERAKEIIRRTDSFFSHGFGGNDRNWNSRVKRLVGMPLDSIDVGSESFKWSEFAEAREAWRKRWGVIDAEYVRNDWLSCSFVGGPHGWCHPDGRIGFVDNVGKWPSVADVLRDWHEIARAFPFLKIGVTIMDGESDEGGNPVVSMRIIDGDAHLVDPARDDVHAGHEPATRRGDRTPTLDEDIARLGWIGREHGIPWSWIEEWSKRVGGAQ